MLVARRFLLVTAGVVSAAAVSSPSHAQLVERDWLAPGDGLLTLDPSTGLEWLDATESDLRLFEGELQEDRFKAIVSATAPGGRFEGFSVASPEEALSLVRSAGIAADVNSYEVNGPQVERLAELVLVYRPSAIAPLRERV